MEFFTTGSSGMIFLAIGLAGLVLTSTATLITGHLLKRKERQIRETIWREYR